MTQVGAPAVGEVLADRYRLEEHIHDDATGRQVWRGVDVILRRPVTIVLKCPGGAAAEGMLQAAVVASRIVHPHTVGVYDAVDEGDRAYVVREFVDGRSLRDVVASTGPIATGRATAVAHAIADALAAVHETGVAHGNVRPGAVLLSSDDRIVLGDAHTGPEATRENDIRGLGGVLYAALTGYWPAQLPGETVLPMAPGPAGRLATPRQLRPDVPNYLDALTMDLLDEALPVPTAAELSGELARLDVVNEVSGPLDLVAVQPPESSAPSRTIWKKLAVGIAALAAISLVGLLIGTRWVTSSNAGTPGDNGTPTHNAQQHSGPALIKPVHARIIDPQGGDRTELPGAQKTIDNSPTSEWQTQEYYSSDFSNHVKRGMGVLIDLGKKHDVTSVSADFSDAGGTVGLKMGDTDPANGSSGTTATDEAVLHQYAQVPGAGQEPVGVHKSWTLSGVHTRYVMLWITGLPEVDADTFQIGVLDITVRGT